MLIKLNYFKALYYLTTYFHHYVWCFCPFSDDALGGDMFWSLGVHLYTPLPFRPGGLAERFRTHIFATAGNLAQFTGGMYLYRIYCVF